MSDELAQDDEGFEIADFGADGLEDDDDPETAAAHKGDRTQPGQEGPRYDPPQRSAASGAAPHTANGGPTAKDIPRESLDGETIFAVGEDGDRWSDEGSDDDEAKKLTGGKET